MRTWLSWVVVLLVSAPVLAGEIGFEETFALSGDRAKALEQLIPGTRDYYYYTCLHAQNQGDFAKVEATLKLWIKRYGHTRRVEMIRNRQALLRYEQNPKGSIEFIRWRLGLNFNHQREVAGRKPNYPTRLDANLISKARLTAEARRRYQNLQGFEDTALDWVARMDLNPGERRDLLRRLTRPDVANLPKLVADDLGHKYSRGFGSLGVHGKMLRDQLDALRKRKPDLRNNTNFINTYLTKLRPNPDTDWRRDVVAREAYLTRLWTFVRTLDPAHNSLKVHVLYHRLRHDHERGVHDKARLMEYLKLPRSVSYVNPLYLSDRRHRNVRAYLGSNFRNYTQLEAVRNDEPLVRAYLMHFFVGENSYKPYETYIRDTYLKDVFAETKIVNGLGDMERWYSMLNNPTKYQQLKERVDIDFAPTNPKHFRADSPVTLDLHIKNVRTLIVKVFEINTLNYYRDRKQPVPTNISLDGLVANAETVRKYNEPPLRRVRRRFAFPELTRPGVYVIEFIGNGKSSRAVVRKGQLRFIEQITAAGHAVRILDEDNKRLAGASLRLGGREYEADKDGMILVPFTAKPGRQPVILSHGGFHTLDWLDHKSEAYRFHAGIHVDRESLVRGKTAKVIVRPSLYLGVEPVTLSILKDTRLVIRSTDRDGVSSTKTVTGFALAEDKESVYEFQVPDNLQSIHFGVYAKVRNVGAGKDQDLSAQRSITINRIDRTEKIEDLHLSRQGGAYILYLLGKTGEPKPDRAVNLTFKHRDFRRSVTVTLQTDARGRTELGALADITKITARGPEGTAQTWYPRPDRHSYPGSIHGRAGQAVRIPYMGASRGNDPLAFSLLEVRGGRYVADHLKRVSLGGGFLEISDLPAGDYALFLKESGVRINLRLTGGVAHSGHVLSDKRVLSTVNRKPLQIVDVAANNGNVRIRLANYAGGARVHVAATRFVPAHSVFHDLGSVPFPEPSATELPAPESFYLSGRDIGDEYRYILERRYAKKFPGNMLKRPQLLLNPWAIRDTSTGLLTGKGSGAYGKRSSRSKKKSAMGRLGRGQGRVSPSAGFSNLDFLADASVVLTNLKPDNNGVVTVKRADLGHAQQVLVVAVDPRNTVYRSISLPEAPGRFTDRRLKRALDNTKHFAERKQVTVVPKGGKFSLGAVGSSDLEVYDTLAKVFNFYRTLNGDATLTQFAFITNWPKLSDEKKRAKYSKYACHELSFFLYRKDSAFFKAAIKPYLGNKKDKTFLDHWLLGHDLSEYLKPWNHARLNIVERILLAQRAPGEAPATARHVKDLYELLPPNIERRNHLFRTAIRGSALETGDALGFDQAKAGANEKAIMLNGLDARFSIVDGSMSIIRGLTESRARSGGKSMRRLSPAASPAPPPAAPAKPKAAAPAADKKAARKADAPEEEADEAFFGEREEDAAARGKWSLAKRNQARQFYRKLEATKEWVENNYYRLPIEQHVAQRVTTNAFWTDYAAHDGKGPFFSKHLAEASRNFTEILLALAVLDLPFEAGKHKTGFEDGRFRLTAASPSIVFHKEIQATPQGDGQTPILVSQNYFRHGDRYRHVNGERLDKYVTEEFLVHTVYGCQVVLTNPTSAPQKLDLLLQIPLGALPVNAGFYTRGKHVPLPAYGTKTFEYHFYFPQEGAYPHYPLHVAKNETLIAFAKPTTLRVLQKLTRVDTESWDYVSQHGSDKQVTDHLKANNVHRLNLRKIAWRMRNQPLFNRVIALLAARHAYDNTLWSYGLLHNAPAAIREHLQHQNRFVAQCGAYIDSPLLTIDPVVRRTYQHMEYSPLVNARTHKFGQRRKIANERFFQQYRRLMNVLAFRKTLDDTDRMAVTYCLLLQDRVEQGMDVFKTVNRAKITEGIQHDYLRAYLDFYADAPTVARQIAARYADHPVDRWRNAFREIRAQLDEIDGKIAGVTDKDDRGQRQTRLAATEPNFDFSVEAKKVAINFQNLEGCAVNYYPMDIELLFSRSPFMQNYSGQFSYIRPNKSEAIRFPAGRNEFSFDLPKDYHGANVMVEILAGGKRKAQAYFAHSLMIQVLENYGQVRVTHKQTGKPIAKVYVKVYARQRGGRVAFHKDGYTDHRGRLDFASLNTGGLDRTERFALLIMSPNDGAVIREAAPPKQ